MDIPSLRQAVEASPDNIPLLLLYAKALTDAFELDEAKECYEHVLKLDPDNPKAVMGLVNVLQQFGKYSEGIIRLEHLKSRNPTMAHAWLLLAELYLVDEQLKLAKEHYARACELDPKLRNPDLERRMGLSPATDEDAKKKARPMDIGGFAAGAVREPEEDEPERFDGTEALKLEFLDKREKIDFSSVGGMEQLKETIRMKILYPLQNRELFAAYGKKAGGGVLLYGPPGCGKTLISRATAGEIDANFISVGLHQVLNMWLGESEAKLHGIFELARQHAPAVLFFDEIDALAADRKDLRTSAGRTLINQFLAELDGNISDNKDVLVLGATNAPWHLDSAFLRPGRFDQVIFAPPPDEAARSEILGIHLKNKPAESIDIDKAAGAMKNFSGADIMAAVDTATESAVAEAMKKGKLVPISTKALIAAAKKTRPSTLKWFDSAKNYALYANQSGFYDDVLLYLGMKK
ncbi:MAG: AAA family ATPase [Verrucomicrobiota bacterium JB024]|nr:AAA family ATPase [Verrucomicrobiota bacterium JB024]